MNVVLLSGGSGTRLWPLSNDIRSKQFIKIFKKNDGTYESMVQRMYRGITEIDSNANIVIATSRTQVSSINNQLENKVDISIEPCRKDTFPAIALATAFIADVKKIPENETVVICPVDPYVDSDYFEMLRFLSEQIDKEEANIALMGIEPTYPSEKYGYIIPETSERISRVQEFKEKPTEEKAKEYIASGALWNGGVFAFKIGYVLKKAHEIIDFTDYYDLLSKYESLDKISFDYAVVEKESSIQVIRFSGQWKDLGTWNTLSEAMSDNIIGDATTDESCDNVSVINELDMPILAMGMKNVVISASPDGILVSDKQSSAGIKKYVDGIKRDVKFAEKSWGTFRVIDVEEESLTIKVTLKAGDKMTYHSHKHRDEVWVVASGHGRTIVDGMNQPVNTGDVIAIQAGCKHLVMAETDMIIIEVQLGKEISVKDKERHPLEEVF